MTSGSPKRAGRSKGVRGCPEVAISGIPGRVVLSKLTAAKARQKQRSPDPTTTEALQPPKKQRGYHRLGVLGGMGYHATTNFLKYLGEEFNRLGVREDHDFPEILTLNLPLQDFNASGAVSDSVGHQVTDGIRRLIDFGAELIAVPCNSVHEYYDDYSLLGVPVVNIIRETQKRAAGVMGVLCSAQTRRAKLYEAGGRDVVYVSDQSMVDRAIQGVIYGGHPYLNNLLDELRHAGADSLVLGCTELSLCLFDGPVVDSSQVLAQAVAECATSS